MNKKVLILRKSLDNTEIINIYVLSIKNNIFKYRKNSHENTSYLFSK